MLLYFRGYQTVGLASPGGRFWSSGVSQAVCMRGIFILKEIWVQDKICILVGTLLGWDILLIT
jgi:hypothetical protein